MARAAAALLVPALALAGCIAAPSPGADPAAGLPLPGAVPTHLPWGLSECRWLIASVPVDEAALARHLPEGFEPARGGVLPGPVPVLPGPTVSVEVFRCMDGVGLDGAPLAPMEYGSFYTGVVPPAHLATAAVEDMYFVKWTTLIPDAGRRAALAEGGLDVRAGSVMLEGAESAGPGSTIGGSLDLEGIGTSRLTMVGRAAFPGNDEARWFREYTPTPRGLAGWQAQYTSGPGVSGHGTLEVPAGSLPAELMGATQAPARIVTGVYTFFNGTIALPDGPWLPEPSP